MGDARRAVIPNYKEGGNAFEQRDVEFPVTWSQNATNIVAQKYFRGPLGTPQRESSIAGSSARGRHDHRLGAQGPLLRERRGRESSRKSSLLVTQKAFQLAGVVQRGCARHAAAVHACFILAVDDTMSSILNWYVEEGTIFKGGSGLGDQPE